MVFQKKKTVGEIDSNGFNVVSINKVFHLAMMKSVRQIREFFIVILQ